MDNEAVKLLVENGAHLNAEAINVLLACVCVFESVSDSACVEQP